MRWARHVVHMGEMRNVYEYLVADLGLSQRITVVCSVDVGYWRFRGTWCLHLQGRNERFWSNRPTGRVNSVALKRTVFYLTQRTVRTGPNRPLAPPFPVGLFDQNVYRPLHENSLTLLTSTLITEAVCDSETSVTLPKSTRCKSRTNRNQLFSWWETCFLHIWAYILSLLINVYRKNSTR
jgi:hypothetical protein